MRYVHIRRVVKYSLFQIHKICTYYYGKTFISFRYIKYVYTNVYKIYTYY